ncbi:putative AT DNA binding protein [Aspergillus thermomutatus]|uniref:AT DNA binding protein n=1 Tax=Aspergillus thermomutatus TaxID=41047 RepID=A0A397GET7_ASPTH|nr:uncharacterized protein CDV56_104552 [Aspergillus thermomutatus]RHZ49451.1 hypothetical protein CDV56_104552 [Aspergillus thermomutatus]
MFSQSSSSSPDILGPPGDADYLISSPIRPFSGRQSFMSPANFKLLQTPRTGKGKRSRINLSPAKSAHSIRFDDVLLPMSPTMKLNGRQRSLSPDKAHADGNVSPWRIRVTLEATQDEEMNQGSPARKRLRPSTAKTTKIPLKDAEDHAEQTPRRRRGRPRKSDIREQGATPTAGSPGHTPGPGGASGQKRKRGRPRKQSLNPDTVDGDEQVTDSADHQETRLVEPGLEREQRWSPLNLAGDADSDDDALPEGFMPVDTFPEDNNMGQPDATAWDRSSPRIPNERTYDTPDVTAVDQVYGQNHDEEPQSTPSKMPSPSRESQGFSPDNTLHAGHTPRPPRSYPSPTSSSLGDDDRAVQVESKARAEESGHEQNTTRPTNDPTDEHREFDSIMESEGFSMVSLDTLPSVKQHGLSINSQTGKGALKPFLAREKIATAEMSKRKVSSLNLNHRKDPPDVEGEKESSLQATEPQVLPVSAEKNQSAPALLRESPVSAFVPKQRNPLARLARIIRAGVALEGTLRRPYEGAPVPTPGTPDLREQISSLEAPKRRLELLFSDLHPRMRRELRAGLGFAQELAKRRRKTEIERARQMASVEARLTGNAGGTTTTPQQVFSGAAVKDTPSTEMKRRLEEWQREREAVSREIQMANASQVIVVDSDTTGPPSPEIDANGNQLGNQSDQEADLGGPHRQESGDYLAREVYDEDRPDQDVDPGESPRHDLEAIQAEEVYEEEDEDGYEDIWQQEARDHSNISHRSSTLYRRENDDVEARQESSPSESSPAPSEPRGPFSPKSWTNDNGKVPFLGHSRVKRLREQTVDLSTVLRGEETPRHIRRYYGQSSPEKSASGHSAERQRSNPDYPEENAEDYGIEDDQDSHIYLESSPNRASDDDTFQIDPTTRHESERQRADQMAEEIEDEHIPATALADQRSVLEENSTTPAQNRYFGGDGQASTWIQKITSLTPGWLKAPVRKSFGPTSPGSEEASEAEHEEEPDVRSANAETHLDDQMYPEETDESPRQVLESAEQNNAQPDSPTSSAARPVEEVRAETYEPQFPLAVSGYFTDDHYALLRRLYRLAKRHPERFPYYPAPGRSDIIGDWIWTSDGEHGVRVTETQFAIIDRFVQELARGDLQAGGTGQIGWTEADMHRRLISVIIGERIREEMRAEMSDKGSAQQMGGRGAALTAWRR